jgi:hypothetical protein
VKIVRLRRPKIMFSLICRYRPKTNALILLDMGYTLRGEPHRKNMEKKGNLKLECG